MISRLSQGNLDVRPWFEDESYMVKQKTTLEMTFCRTSFVTQSQFIVYIGLTLQHSRLRPDVFALGLVSSSALIHKFSSVIYLILTREEDEVIFSDCWL